MRRFSAAENLAFLRQRAIAAVRPIDERRE
jgi:hypothetical protein